MVSRLILNLKNAAQVPAVWALESRSYHGDDDDYSKDGGEGGLEGGRFQVGITTEGPTGAVELSNLFVTRQEMGRISKLGRVQTPGLGSSGKGRAKRLSKLSSGGVIGLK
jgi:hypothetical protein